MSGNNGMSRELVLTEARLQAALERLLAGKPAVVKASGKLSLNKINKEAGLGHSYIHKFKEFVERAKPVIANYNHEREQSMASGLGIEIGVPLTEFDDLRGKLKKATKLKDKYRLERDNAVAARKILEEQLVEMTHRAYDLQEQVRELKGQPRPSATDVTQLCNK